jgi:hypothetical protein
VHRLIVSVSLFCLAASASAQVFSFTEEAGPGRIDWAERVIYATGTGRASPTESPAAARPKALKAAREDAMRSMLETIYEVSVTSGQTVRDLVGSDPAMRTTIESMAKYFREVGTPTVLGDGTTQVTMEFSIGGEFVRAIFPPTGAKRGTGVQSLVKCPRCGQPWPAGVPVPPELIKESGFDPAEYSFSGMIVDCRGLGMKNFTLAPRVLNERGEEVYGPGWVDREEVLREWITLYSTSVGTDVNARVGDRPFIVKALRTAGDNNSDVVISDNDARILTATEANLKFMEYCRVAFLVN